MGRELGFEQEVLKSGRRQLDLEDRGDPRTGTNDLDLFPGGVDPPTPGPPVVSDRLRTLARGKSPGTGDHRVDHRLDVLPHLGGGTQLPLRDPGDQGRGGTEELLGPPLLGVRKGTAQPHLVLFDIHHVGHSLSLWNQDSESSPRTTTRSRSTIAAPAKTETMQLDSPLVASTRNMLRRLRPCSVTTELPNAPGRSAGRSEPEANALEW